MRQKIVVIAGVAVSLYIAGALSVAVINNKKGAGPSAAARKDAAVLIPVPGGEDGALYNEARSLKEDGRLSEAKAAYKKLLAEYPDSALMPHANSELEEVNMGLLFSSAPMPESVVHEVVGGDTLTRIAKKYNTTVDIIKKANSLNSDMIMVGQRLKVPTSVFSILVDKSQNALMLKANGDILKTYMVSTGKDNCTPVGTFKITLKEADPAWYKPNGGVVPPGDPNNFLGTRWLGIDKPRYGIHGTNDESTIGRQITEGCVRMHNKDAEELYSIVPLGTEVTIID